MSWHIILLNPSEVAHGKREEFIERFEQLYESNKPQSCALFESRIDGEGWRGQSNGNDTS